MSRGQVGVMLPQSCFESVSPLGIFGGHKEALGLIFAVTRKVHCGQNNNPAAWALGLDR